MSSLEMCLFLIRNFKVILATVLHVSARQRTYKSTGKVFSKILLQTDLEERVLIHQVVG